MPTRFRCMLVALVVVAAGCRGEGAGVTAPAPMPGQAAGILMNCQGSAAGMACAPSTGPAQGVFGDIVYGGQDQYVRLIPGTAFFNSVGNILQQTVTVQNLLGQPIGTGDWVTPDTGGVKVFFHAYPTNGVVHQSRTGTGTFTASNQDYIKYAELIPGNGRNRASVTWQFALPDASTTFTFQVFISTRAPVEAGGVVANVPPHAFSALGRHTGNGSNFCAVRSGSSLYCWGLGANGKLGVNATYNYPQPMQVLDPAGFSTASAGSTHACAVTVGGAAKCWGGNANGEVGDGSTTARLLPVTVIGSGIASIVVGDNHSCALTTSGTLQCWGVNASGQLGLGATSAPQLTPAAVTALGSGVTQVSLGRAHSCAVVSGGAMCWGENLKSQLGNAAAAADTSTPRATPLAVDGLSSGVTMVAAGHVSTCAVAGGGVKCWGRNTNGQLGNGTIGTATTDQKSPADVVGLGAGSNVTSVVVGTAHACALTSSGVVKCWGSNTAGQMGQGNVSAFISPQTTPVDVPGVTAVSISAAGSTTCALVADGTLRCWGDNASGSTGDGTIVSPRSSPVSTVIP